MSHTDTCSNCVFLQSGIDELTAWVQRNESDYAQRHLKLSRLISTQSEAQTANVISHAMTLTLEKIDELFPQPEPSTKGLLPRLRQFLFGA